MKGYFSYDTYWARVLGLALFSVRLLHDPQDERKMPRKKPKGFAGEKSKHNQEMQKLDQGDNTKGNNPPFWVELFVNVMMYPC